MLVCSRSPLRARFPPRPPALRSPPPGTCNIKHKEIADLALVLLFTDLVIFLKKNPGTVSVLNKIYYTTCKIQLQELGGLISELGLPP